MKSVAMSDTLRNTNTILFHSTYMILLFTPQSSLHQLIAHKLR
jgi:hypothetical protein